MFRFRPESRLTRLWRKAAEAGRLMCGLPDYQTYLSHRREHHPGQAAMSYEEFFRERQVARYGRGASRCC